MSDDAFPNYDSLDGDKIAGTIERLGWRIGERFPGSGLGQACQRLHAIAIQAKQRSEWIDRPLIGLRLAIAFLIALILVGLVAGVMSFGGSTEPMTFIDFVQALEAGINDVVLIGAGIFFLATLENRIKRSRALAAVHELRALAHIIDMLQLTKDPERVLSPGESLQWSPPSTMTAFELGRYLDYCSEMLSLTGKIAALYVQNFDDSVALAAVNEIEGLTTGLSRKIWQKIMILHSHDAAGGEG